MTKTFIYFFCFTMQRLMMLTVLLLGFAVNPVSAIESTRFTDVIKSNGSGDIDLFNPSTNGRVVDGPALEQFRLDNNGQLAFAVDVNEAADGSEKSSSQAVTIDTATLILTIGGTDYTYGVFTTTTRTLLARKGETNRSLYYSLIGDSGSNRITTNSSSDIYASSFDSTLSFDVPDDISGTTAARLLVTLLETNVQLGDPEAFYDFSNGFEDVAIITKVDSDYLNNLGAGQAEAPLVLPAETFDTGTGSRVYYPSQTEFYLAAYEDLFPNKGDYDFNDLVVAYRVYANLDASGLLVSLGGEGYLVARGADFIHDWHLRILLPQSVNGSGQLSLFQPLQTSAYEQSQIEVNSGELDVLVFERARSLWVDTDGNYKFVNTPSDQALKQGHRFSFTVTLDASIDLKQFDEPPFDPYIYVHNTGYEIHLEGKSPVLSYSINTLEGLTSFTDPNGYPFAMILPEDWLIPVELEDLGAAYPDFIDFVSSNGNNHSNWYLNQAPGLTRPLYPSVWKW